MKNSGKTKKITKIIFSIALVIITISILIPSLNNKEKIKKKINIEDKTIEEIKKIHQDKDFRKNVKFNQNEAIIMLKKDIDIKKCNFYTKYNFIDIEEIECIDNNKTYRVFFKEDVWAMIDKLNKEDEILNAEPNFIYEIKDINNTQIIVNNELYQKQWYLNTMSVPTLWKNIINTGNTPGQDIIIAVIDTGVDLNHESLKNALWNNNKEIPGNGIDDDKNGYIDDINGINPTSKQTSNPNDDSDSGHGTHVAGIIAMQPSATSGIGIAYGSKIMALKAADAKGNLEYSNVIKCIRYAYKNGADIINMSFGGPDTVALEMALKEAKNAGCLLIGAAGNMGAPTIEGKDKIIKKYALYDNYPAASSYTLGVMAYDENKQLAYYSNWDYAGTEKYSIVAPGSNILGPSNKGGYCYKSGTSMATAVTSGIAACLMSTNKNINADNIAIKLHSNNTIQYLDNNKIIHTYSEINTEINQKINIRNTNIKINSSNCIYNGKAQKPIITIKIGNILLKENIDYKTQYKNNVNIGLASVDIIGINNCMMTITKTFTIIPPKAIISNIKSTNDKTLIINWKKFNNINGYQIFKYDIKTKKYNCIKNITKNSITSYKDINLTSNTIYYYKIRAYKKVNSNYYYGPYSNIFKQMTLPRKANIIGTGSTKNTTTLVWTKDRTVDGYEIYRYNNKTKKYMLIKTITNNSINKYMDKKLKGNTSYEYKIRTYKKYNKKYYYSSYSNIKIIRTR